jgi:hypothetical protein
MVEFKKYPLEERYFVIDDSPIAKRGRNIDNVSFIYDHNSGGGILGFSIVTLGLFTGEPFYRSVVNCSTKSYDPWEGSL